MPGNTLDFLVMSGISWSGRRAEHEEVIVDSSGVPVGTCVDVWYFWKTGASDQR